MVDEAEDFNKAQPSPSQNIPFLVPVICIWFPLLNAQWPGRRLGDADRGTYSKKASKNRTNLSHFIIVSKVGYVEDQ